MQHVLRAISGPHAGAVYVLGSRTTIGRASDCDIQILHEGVSRHHAKLTLEDDGTMVVADLSSDNGTFVDDARVERHVLRSGDVLRVMRSRFTYELLHTHDAQTSAVFRRKVTSGDSLRQTIVHDKGSATLRAGLTHGVPAGVVGERGRPYSRPQAAAPALSGARPGAAAAFGAERGDEPLAATASRGASQGLDATKAASWSGTSEKAASVAREPERGALPVEERRSSEATAARLTETGASVRGRYGALGRGRREPVAPTSFGPLPSSSSTRLERVAPPLPPSGPSGRMAPLGPTGSEHEPEARLSTAAPVAAPATTGPIGSGWVRVNRPLVTPGSMRPGSTLSGMQRIDADASPPAPRPAPPPSPLLPPRPARKPITAEYGAIGDPEVTERAPRMSEPAPTEPSPTAPEPVAAVPEADLDVMKTVPTVRRAKRPAGSSTPTEEVPRMRGRAARADVLDEDAMTKTQPRVTLVPQRPGPGPAPHDPEVRAAGPEPRAAAPREHDGKPDASEAAPTVEVAAIVEPSSAIPVVPPSRRLTLTGGARGGKRPLAYEDTLRIPRSMAPEPRPAAAPDAPQARPHANSAEIISALEALLPPTEQVPVPEPLAARPDAQTREPGVDASPLVDALLVAAVADDSWPPDAADFSEVDRVELRAQQLLEQADRDHKRRDGLERLVDVLEYRALRFQALQGAPGDAREAQRCAALEELLQQRPPVGDDMAAMRRYHRFVCSIPAQLTHRPRGTTTVATVEITDLSAGGAKITFAEHTIGVGETVWLAIDLAQADRSRIPYPDAKAVVMKARVVWAQPHEANLGLIFAGAPRYELGGAEGP